MLGPFLVTNSAENEAEVRERQRLAARVTQGATGVDSPLVQVDSVCPVSRGVKESPEPVRERGGVALPAVSARVSCQCEQAGLLRVKQLDTVALGPQRGQPRRGCGVRQRDPPVERVNDAARAIKQAEVIVEEP